MKKKIVRIYDLNGNRVVKQLKKNEPNISLFL